ncbi:hypothetical protein ACFX2B_030727 [Malus domestica]
MEFPAADRLGIEDTSSSIMTFSCRRLREDAVELSVRCLIDVSALEPSAFRFRGLNFVISVFFFSVKV